MTHEEIAAEQWERCKRYLDRAEEHLTMAMGMAARADEENRNKIESDRFFPVVMEYHGNAANTFAWLAQAVSPVYIIRD